MSGSSRWAPANAGRPEMQVWTSARVKAAKQQQQRQEEQPKQSKLVSKQLNGVNATTSSQAAPQVKSVWGGGAQAGRPRPSLAASTLTAPPRAPPSNSASTSSSIHAYATSNPALKAPQISAPPAPAFVRRQGKQLGGQIDPMALIASPSRGLDDDEAGRNIARVATGQEDASEAMDLTNHTVQANFRAYISRRIASHIEVHGRAEGSFSLPVAGPSKLSPKQEARQHSWEQVGLLCRKLREGVVASARVDGFAVEAYMLSTFVSLLANNLNQLHTSLSRLVLVLFPAVVIASPPRQDSALTADLKGLLPSKVLEDCLGTRAFIASLYLLLQAFPSSGTGRIGGEKAATASDAGRSGAWWATRSEVLDKLGPAVVGGVQAQEEDWIGLAEALRSASLTTDSVKLRALLLGQSGFPTPSTLHLRLVAIALPPLRTRAWRTLQRAYMTVPLDGSLFGLPSSQAKSSWLEERLLLDVYACPPSEEELESLRPSNDASSTAKPLTKPRKASPPPDSWEEEEGKDDGSALASRVKGLSIERGSAEVILDYGPKVDGSTLNELRARRLADFLDSVGLAPSSTSGATAAPEGQMGGLFSGPLGKWKGRIVDAPGARDGGKGFKVR